MQGVCLSVILFIVYLVQAMTPNMPIYQGEHSYAKHVQHNPVPNSPRKPTHKEDHSCASKPNLPNHIKPVVIDPQYSDDVTWHAVLSNFFNIIKYMQTRRKKSTNTHRR